MAGDDEPVGYGRPPRAHRFRKGVSGNPKGRPRIVHDGPAEHAILRKVISRKINIAVDGRTRRVPIKEAIAFQLVDKAAKGDFRAMKEIMAIAAIGEGCRELPAKFVGEFDVLVKRLSSLSDLEEALGHAGLLFSDADHNLYFKRGVFEAATVAQGPRRLWPELRLTTPKIEAAGGATSRECMFDLFGRVFENLFSNRL